MRGRVLFVGPVLAAGFFQNKKGKNNGFLSTFSKGDAHYLNKITINDKTVFNLESASSKGVGTCNKVDDEGGLQSVEVCGVQFRTRVYLKHGCTEEDSHIEEVKICDGTQAADSCVKVLDSQVEFLSNALSYEILPCDPEVPAPPVDTSGHSSADVAEASDQAAGDVAEAEMAAEAAAEASGPPPSPALPSSPVEAPADPAPQQIAQPPPPSGLSTDVGPSDIPAPPSDDAGPPRGKGRSRRAPRSKGPPGGRFQFGGGGETVIDRRIRR